MGISVRIYIFSVIMLIALSVALPVHAIEEYADLTGQECSVCHFSDTGGGGLTPAGEEYGEDPDAWRPPARTDRRTTVVFRMAHLLILYMHIFFGFVWVGTILYIHLVLKPKYAIGGLPRSELRLAWLSMPAIAITGVLLTVYRIQSAPGLFQTVFGKLLLGKIGVFTLMLCSATFVTLFIGPRLRRIAAGHALAGDVAGKTQFTPEELHSFDGDDGRKVFVAVNGDIWDLSASSLWMNGHHAGRHKAGEDLTDYLPNAPHGTEVFEKYEKVGTLMESDEKVPVVVRIFSINAYFNLIGCFLIILFLALWRW